MNYTDDEMRRDDHRQSQLTYEQLTQVYNSEEN